MKILTSKNKQLFLLILIIGALCRVLYIYFTLNWLTALWLSICLIWVVWIIFAFFYNKDMYGAFHWNNGENQVPRAMLAITMLGIYFLLLFNDFR
ncbi:hypothetical protein [Solimicrobium silvestre]|uniref:Uncharacterized protein n=1 Tax=Solimicrobium silvestre TaxID=2099400 RepID=A0A2S9GSB8_9BURK|nr:hypothetical protein [Solimicrobium silvestre]PRC90622.1 hypothetical protein S2091_4673 [Solimicrobium silvestre]